MVVQVELSSVGKSRDGEPKHERILRTSIRGMTMNVELQINDSMSPKAQVVSNDVP
jgi:hypothetical protein